MCFCVYARACSYVLRYLFTPDCALFTPDGYGSKAPLHT